MSCVQCVWMSITVLKEYERGDGKERSEWEQTIRSLGNQDNDREPSKYHEFMLMICLCDHNSTATTLTSITGGWCMILQKPPVANVYISRKTSVVGRSTYWLQYYHSNWLWYSVTIYNSSIITLSSQSIKSYRHTITLTSTCRFGLLS